ncbi:MAG: hypothetical protein PWR21_1267 [Methanoculleus sp.]|nr:hypothetical protein [Methanoculleus sp.]
MQPSYHISGIVLPQEDFTCLGQNDIKEKSLKNLSKLNIFIGENNSGKSRLIRELVSSDFGYYPKEYSFDRLNECIEKIRSEITEFAEKHHIDEMRSTRNVLSVIKQLQDIEQLHRTTNLLEILESLREAVEKMVQSNAHYTSTPITEAKVGKTFADIIDRCMLELSEDYVTLLQPHSFSRIYIPILRGLRPIEKNGDVYDYTDLYVRRTLKDYFQDNFNGFDIFTGLKAYKQVKEHLLGNLHQRKLIREYEEYLSEFFDGKPVALIPSENPEEVLVIKIGDEQERPIFELGDGIQSLIIITMPLFLHRNEDVLLFVEEPELLLHPGLQRKLLETLMQQKGFERFQYFITTHSNHFLDITLDFPDISIYSVKKTFDESTAEEKKPEFVVENLSHGDRSALEQLGVRNSSVYLSNCTIWVEGITDRLYLRWYLEVFYEKFDNKEKFKEDFHYSFVEYSGSNITHWSFLDNEEEPISVDRLCGRLFLIADRDDGTSTAKIARHAKLKSVLEDRFYVFDCKEIENQLSPSVLKRVLKSYGEDETCLPAINQEEYKDKNLGQYIEDILGEQKKRKGSYIDGNTISDKVGFCRKAISHIETWDDLSPEAQLLTEKLFDFILANQEPKEVFSSSCNGPES